MQAGLRRRRAGVRAAANDSDEEDEVGAAGRAARGAARRGAAAAHSDDEDDANNPAEKPIRAKDRYEADRRARDAEREAQEAALEEELKQIAVERAKKEAQEAEKWMHTFTVEDAGEQALTQEAGEEQLTRMVEYLQNRKTAALEEVAAEFGLRTSEVVSKVQSLESEGRITGIMDDRGKFIYISTEEMTAVAEFIRNKGRIAIAELASKSARFIDLEGKAALSINTGGDVGDLDVLLNE
jgi:DDRGK domain-containing protein 1